MILNILDNQVYNSIGLIGRFMISGRVLYGIDEARESFEAECSKLQPGQKVSLWFSNPLPKKIAECKS
ncbi:MAG: hypothetical protein HOP11_03475 [Saprospiraceae bacterium]|nr:hypothetical protein [Saprospiraceae bacterium]